MALLAEKVPGLKNGEVTFGAVGVPSATPLTYSLRRDDCDFVVFCFSKSEFVSVASAMLRAPIDVDAKAAVLGEVAIAFKQEPQRRALEEELRTPRGRLVRI